jgi:ABC-type dipeptide/oligopeptide/nickel transport system permease component
MSWRFLLERLLWSAVVIVGITIITFTLTRLIPADPARAAAGPDASTEAVETLRTLMGLDRPLPVQYVSYMRDLVALNFGRSIQTQRYVREDLAAFFPATAELTLWVMLAYITTSIGLGVAAAISQGRALDYAIRVAALVGVGLPAFWLGLMLQIAFYQHLGWLPAAGRLDPFIPVPPRLTGFYVIDSALAGQWQALGSSAQHLVLPVVAVMVSRLAVGLKLTRISLLEVLGEDYIRTARSKGLRGMAVIYKHGLRNALIPIVTALGMQFSALLGGTVIVEVVFAWPGIGRYAVGSVRTLDFPAIMSVTVVLAVAFLAVNLLVDMLYVWLDPRVKYT